MQYTEHRPAKQDQTELNFDVKLLKILYTYCKSSESEQYYILCSLRKAPGQIYYAISNPKQLKWRRKISSNLSAMDHSPSPPSFHISLQEQEVKDILAISCTDLNSINIFLQQNLEKHFRAAAHNAEASEQMIFSLALCLSLLCKPNPWTLKAPQHQLGSQTSRVIFQAPWLL